VKDLGIVKSFLGLTVNYDTIGNSLTIHQHHFIDRILARFGFSDCKPVSTHFNPSIKLTSDISPKTPEDKAEMLKIPYREAVGSLMYLMIGSRPDLAYSVSLVSRFMEDPGLEHWKSVKQIFKYIKGTKDLHIEYKYLPTTPNSISVFCDADWGGDTDTMKSNTGYLTLYNEGVTTWNSRLQPTVAKSTIEAEYIGLSAACDEVMWL
jgi:hypothetical protein